MDVFFNSRVKCTRHIVISLVLDIYGLFKMVFDCLWVVVAVFAVAVRGC